MSLASAAAAASSSPASCRPRSTGRRSPRPPSTRSSPMARTAAPGWPSAPASITPRHVAEEFRERGISCATIFGDTPEAERDRIIAAFKRGEIRALASMGVLTTGFNAPAVDLIAMLRPTKSAGLYVQMAGRGTRLAPGKENCLVLDFAGNVSRHGPVDWCEPRSARRGRRRGAHQGLPGVRQHPGGRRAANARTADTCSRRRRSRSPPTAITLAILSTEAAAVGCGDRRQLQPAREAGQAAVAAGRLPLRPRPPQRMGLLRASPATPGARPRRGGGARSRRAGARHRRGGAARSGALPTPTTIWSRPSGRFTEVSITGSTHAPSPGLCAVCHREPRHHRLVRCQLTRSRPPPRRGAASGSAAASARTSVTGGAA